jgi:hypothetical protein
VVKENGSLKPVSVIHFDTLPKVTIVPVIFIKEYVFANITVVETDSLLTRIHRLITAINKSAGINPTEIQIDCDWTKKTRNDYFNFLSQYKKRYGNTLSSTIRLHQVKYPESMGIPPVDKGALMFYNMGRIGADTSNSIYDAHTAARYTAYLDEYPLQLDLALPIFGWSIQLRDGKVVELLNKSITTDDVRDTTFVSFQRKFYVVNHDGFRNGSYFRKGDKIKQEFVTGEQLLDIAKGLDKCMKKPAELIFYDLDSVNLKQYDKQIFEKISNSFN